MTRWMTTALLFLLNLRAEEVVLRLPRLIVVAVALVTACASVPRVPASGHLARYALTGPVDHALASDHLEGRVLPPAL